MKAKELANLLNGINPDAEVYIDLGLCYNKETELIYAMIQDEDFNYSEIETIEVCCGDNGISEIYLCPYDGEYSLPIEEEAEKYFKEHKIKIG